MLQRVWRKSDSKVLFIKIFANFSTLGNLISKMLVQKGREQKVVFSKLVLENFIVYSKITAIADDICLSANHSAIQHHVISINRPLVKPRPRGAHAPGAVITNSGYQICNSKYFWPKNNSGSLTICSETRERSKNTPIH